MLKDGVKKSLTYHENASLEQHKTLNKRLNSIQILQNNT